MALILHVSDLHLSELTEAQTLGDYKVAGLIPLVEQQNRLDLLRSSLSALERWLMSQSLTLDAVVVSGDVSLAYSDAGFSELGSTLAALGSKSVEPARTLVVPGNHDVAWSTPPSSAERYQLFVDRVRGGGYVTPLLEGIDLDASTGRLINTPSPPSIIAPDSEFVLVGMNSANYCGSRTELVGAAKDAFGEALAKVSSDADAQRALERLLSHDIARVSPAQLTALRTELGRLDPPSAGGPIRILATHHQLLPASTDEEFKSFENLSNLGQVRSFLTSQYVNVVLHGHKHQSAQYVDRSPLTVGAEPGVEYLVSSAATVWRQSAMGHEFARLVHIDTRYPRSRRIIIDSVPATIAGSDITHVQRLLTWPVQMPAQGRRMYASGKTVDDVYDNLVGLFDDVEPGGSIFGLSCAIADGQSALNLPESYPDIDGVLDKQAWLDDIVSWWQRPDPNLARRGRRFNHGERIRNYVDRRDQVADVVKALKHAPGTTRAIIQLIDPVRDNVADATQRIPAFFSCHFLIREREEMLDCIAYFRKQQIRMWWPVNVAEIATLQREVVQRLADAGLAVSAGSITTFAARAVDGTSKPRVVVPQVDRAAQDRPADLWAMVYDLFFGDLASARSEFLALFEDWRPSGQVEADGSAIALGGMSLLFEATDVFAERSDSVAGRRLSRALHDLYDANRSYADAEDITNDPSERRVQYERWAAQVQRLTGDVVEALEALEALRT